MKGKAKKAVKSVKEDLFAIKKIVEKGSDREHNVQVWPFKRICDKIMMVADDQEDDAAPNKVPDEEVELLMAACEFFEHYIKVMDKIKRKKKVVYELTCFTKATQIRKQRE